MIFIILSVLLLLLIGAYLFLRKLGGGNFPWIKFYLKGKESGFAFKEINLLRVIAVENRMKDPTSLFWSIKQLDRSIKGLILKFRSKGQEETPHATMMVSKLFQFRKRVEFSKPKYNLGLKSSKEIAPRQRIKISLPNMLPFSSIVIDNLRRYIAVSYPKGPKLPFGFSWKGQIVGINFWREGDAGYYYQTKVIGDYSDKKYPILHLAHKDNVMRTQMRRSVRADVGVPAYIFPLASITNATEEIEEGSGLRCYLIDISSDGAAIIVGGRAKVGLPIKYQFNLGEHKIVMIGVVKSTNFDEKKNRSLLHIQAKEPSKRIKNIIESFVYNIFGEQQETKLSNAPKI
jgi:c-di-GMP-binding flagellar brake protein YcgR